MKKEFVLFTAVWNFIYKYVTIWGVDRLGAIIYKAAMNIFQCNFW